MEKELVLGIAVEKGIISVIDPDGNMRMYRHPLVDKMSIDEVTSKIEKGELDADLFNYHAFPSDWEIETEEPDITGDLATTIDSL